MMHYHFLLFYLLECHLQLGIAYGHDAIAALLKRHGFRRAYRRVRQLRELGLFTERSGLLYLTEKPLTYLNTHELDQLPAGNSHLAELEEPPLEQHLHREGFELPALPEKVSSTTGPDGCFSIFPGPISNTVPHERACTIQGLCRQIQAPPAPRRQLIEAVRAAYGTPEFDRRKRQLPYFTTAGIFSERRADKLLSPSGFGVLDYDYLADVAQTKAALTADEQLRPLLAAVFISPSGWGLKVLVNLPKNVEYSTGLLAIAQTIGAYHPVLAASLDVSGLDIARACFFSYDEEFWLKPIYC